MFDRIVGHEGVLSLLEGLLTESSANGVYLFHGPRSVGKHTVAREFAKMVVCSGTMDRGCACTNCRLFPEVPDYLSIDDSAKSIKVEDAKSLDSFLSLAPYSGKMRAAVVDDADRMNQQVSYSLLKTLEDCGDKAVVVLVSSSESRIPAPIVSRCIPIQFGPLSQGEVSEILSRQGHPRVAVEDVCRASISFSGSILRDFMVYSKLMKRMPFLLKGMASGSEEDALHAVSEAEESGQVVHFTECMVSLLCDVIKMHYDVPLRVAALSSSSDVEALTEAWTDEVCIASCARLSEVLQAARSPLNLKVAPRLQAAISWMCMYVSQAAIRKKMSK